MLFQGFRCAVAVLGLAMLCVAVPTSPAPASSIVGTASLGNWPDAIILTGSFVSGENVAVNGDNLVGATGFLFTLSNSSFGDGSHSSFVNDPDGDFASGDVLTSAAAAALDARQPFGIYEVGAHLPAGSGVTTSAPSGWDVDIELSPVAADPNAVEVSFSVDFGDALFDSTATGIDGIFSGVTGSIQFFISTLSANLFDNLLFEDNGEPAVDVSTSMVWAESGSFETEFDAPGQEFDGEELRPRGEMTFVPEPGTLSLLAFGLVLASPILRSRRAPAA